MEGTPKGMEVEALAAVIKSTPPVLDVHDMHVWTVSDGLHFLSCHVVLPAGCTVSESQFIVAVLNERLHDEFGIGHATIQTETVGSETCRHDTDALYCSLEASHAGCNH
jgi:cobalt-zinc-cadmium efflux system protein